MKGRAALAVSTLAIAAVLFAFFVPVVYVAPTPSNCDLGCAYVGHGPFYESLTNMLAGDGAVDGGPFCCHQSGYFINWSNSITTSGGAMNPLCTAKALLLHSEQA
jgi:hypothetical protein